VDPNDAGAGVNSMEKTKFFLSRRGLMTAVGGAAAAGAALLAAPHRAAIARRVTNLVRGQPIFSSFFLSLADASVEQWSEQIGSIFSVGGGATLKLVGVTALSSPGPRPAQVSRSRAFLAKFDVQNGGTMAGDLIYTASHSSYGAFRIFLSASPDPLLPHRMTALFN
jgi:hypothetical protein